MQLAEIFIRKIQGRESGTVQAKSGKKKWVFVFTDGVIAQTKSNLKTEQAAVFKERFPDASATEILLKQACSRFAKAAKSDELSETEETSARSHNLNPLDVIVHGLSSAYSEAELSGQLEELHLLRPKVTAPPEFADPSLAAVLSAFTGGLKTPDLINLSELSNDLAWAVVWVTHKLDLIEAEQPEEQATLSDLIDFDLDSLIADEIQRPDENIKLTGAPATPAETSDESPATEPQTDRSETTEIAETAEESTNTLTEAEQLEQKVEALETQVLNAEDFFQILEVSEEDANDVIGNAFRNLSLQLHPDRYATASEDIRNRVTELFDKVREAYDTISDAEKKEKYIRHVIQGEKTEESLALEQLEAYFQAEQAFNRGKAFFNQGNISRAHTFFSEAAEYSPESLEFMAYFGYSTFYTHRSNMEEADKGIAIIRDVIEANQEQEKKLDAAWYLIGRAYREKGEANKAKRALTQALRYNPSNAQARRELKRVVEGGGAAPASSSESRPGFFARLFGGGKKK